MQNWHITRATVRGVISKIVLSLRVGWVDLNKGSWAKAIGCIKLLGHIMVDVSGRKFSEGATEGAIARNQIVPKIKDIGHTLPPQAIPKQGKRVLA